MRRALVFAALAVAAATALHLAVPAASAAGNEPEPAVDRIMRVLFWSAVATDRFQTRQWVHATPEHPARVVMAAPAGNLRASGDPLFVCACVYESNPWIAGQPEALEPYFDWWAQAAEVFPSDRARPWMRLAAALILAEWVQTVVENNRTSRLASQVLDDPAGRWSEYLVFEYRLSF